MAADIVGTLYVVLGLRDDASGQFNSAMANMEGSARKATGSMMGDLTNWSDAMSSGFASAYANSAIDVATSNFEMENTTNQATTSMIERLAEWRDATNTSLREYAKWATAIGAYTAPIVAAGLAIYGAVENYGAMAQQIKDFSYVMGLSTTKVQQLQYAATLSGTSFDKVSFAVSNLNLKIAEAGDKSSTAAKAFQDLGVSIEGQTPDQVFDATATALAKVTDSTQRARLGNELLGRSWREVLPFIDEYIAKKDEVAAHETLSKEDIRTLSEYKSTLDGIVSSLNLYIAKAVVAAERATTLGREAAKTSPLSGGTIPGQVAAEKAIKDARNQYEFFAKQYGELAPPSATITETYDVSGVISGMSDLDLQIYEMENITLPALKKAWDEAIAAGDPAAIKEATFAYAQAGRELNEMKSNTDALTSATEGYRDSLQKVLDLEQDRADLTADAVEDLTDAFGSGEQFRSIYKNFQRSMRESDQEMGAAETNVRGAGAALYNTVNPGSVVSGDVIVNFEGKEIARVKGAANTSKTESVSLSKSDLVAAGVRLA